MKKEEIYVNLQGKTKEELTDLWEFLKSVGEKQYDTLERFLNTNTKGWKVYLFGRLNQWTHSASSTKTEVTIQQLKEILQPMGTFTPIAMKCTQEQFEAIKPKLKKLGKIGLLIEAFSTYNYLCNNYGNERNYFDFVTGNKKDYVSSFNIVYEKWNEEIFLKACGIEVESLEQQLQKAEAEVKRLKYLIEEENKIKVGDWAMLWEDDEETPVFGLITDVTDFYLTCNGSWENAKKITNPKLIKLLENECSTKN